MKQLWQFLLIVIVATGCSTGVGNKASQPKVDETGLRSVLQTSLQKNETCVTFPEEISFLTPRRAVRDHIEFRSYSKNGDPKQLLEPMVQAGLIEIKPYPDEKRAKYVILVEFTELGLSVFSRFCSNPSPRYSAPRTTIGFRVLDIEVEKFTFLSEPERGGCVWHIHARYNAKAVNLAPWYDHDSLKNHLNRRIDPLANEGVSEGFASFNSVGGVTWRLGIFDYPHSNLACIEND